MFFCKNIGIWCILLNLLETTKQFVLFEEDNLNSLGVPYDSENVFDKDEIQYSPDYKNNIDDYPKNQKYDPSLREERDIEVYDDYRDEKDPPNLSKSGLGIFSWWKSEAKVKRKEGGTYPPVSNDTDANATVSITVDPAALSTDAITSTSAGPTFLTTCICYNVTEECVPLVVATAVTCIGSDDTSSTTSTDASTTASSITTASSEDTTTPGLNTTIAQTTNGSTADLNTTAITNATTALQNITSDQTLLTSPVGSTSVSMPTVLNMFGAGVFLPVYEFPMTPLAMLNTPSSMPPRKKKPFNRTDHGRNFQLTNLKLNNISINNHEQMHLSENYINKNDNMLIITPSTVINSNENKHKFVYDQAKKADNIVVANANTPSSNIINIGQTAIRNNPFLLNEITTHKQETGGMDYKPNQTFLQPPQKFTNNYPVIIDRKLTSPNDTRINLIQNQRSQELLREPYNISQNTLNVSNKSNQLGVVPAEPFGNPPNKQVNYTFQKNNIQTTENKTLPDMRNFSNYFVKYNDSYLSEKSNTSVNLVDICKNVTCQGNNYLSPCCLRVFGTGKCQGEDFSYLKPIPSYFNNTVNITSIQLDPLLNTKAVDPQALATLSESQKLLAMYTKSSTAETTPAANCSCGSKPNNRVVRENDMNDFVKFQLMHGMSNPNGKEMINALKEASLEIQKVNREFHSNDQGNMFKMNENGQNIHLPVIDNHRLSKKEPEGIALPFSSNKILDGLRATISNSLLQSNFKPSSFQKDKYRFIRNQGLKDQIESIRESNIILEKIKKETEAELQRLCSLEAKRREEELLFERKRGNELKELMTIQDLIHKELESRAHGDPPKRAISDTEHALTQQFEPTRKGSSIYSNTEKNMDDTDRNDLDNLILDRYSSIGSNTSNSFKPSSNLVDIDKFPELEIHNSANIPHGDALLLLDIGSDKETLAERQRKRREGSNNTKNKILKENIKSVHSTENNTGMLR